MKKLNIVEIKNNLNKEFLEAMHSMINRSKNIKEYYILIKDDNNMMREEYCFENISMSPVTLCRMQHRINDNLKNMFNDERHND